jgi:uncharacterized protein YbjT (DUF2867 family)
MRVLVVGATGALGRDVVAAALEERHDVAALLRNRSRADFPADVETVEGDVLDVASVTAAVRTRDAVICALGAPRRRRPSTLLRDGTENLVAAMPDSV